MEMNIFEKATKEKVRFSYKGNISVEDLWDLSLTALDSIYGELENSLEKLPKKSLLSTTSNQRDEIEFKQEIIKHIVEVKQSENNAKAIAKENSAKKQMILDLIAKKQNQSYENMSVEELTALANSL